jgi:hypothetical protein
MENIIEKLKEINNIKSILDNWSLEDIKKLLDIYFIISKKEEHIFDLIYIYHKCDRWEEFFCDYEMQYLKDKVNGVEVAITEINEIMKQKKEKEG